METAGTESWILYTKLIIEQYLVFQLMFWGKQNEKQLYKNATENIKTDGFSPLYKVSLTNFHPFFFYKTKLSLSLKTS